MSPEIEELGKLISTLPLKEALALLVVKRISKIPNEIKQIIQTKYNEGKYAFVPDKDEADRLKEFGNEPIYKQVQLLVPNYQYIDVLRTGLLIDHYHKNDTAKNRDRVKSIKTNIVKRPNGQKLLKIANFPTTPFFALILRYLYELKITGFTDKQLEETFDEVVTDWEKATLFVTNRQQPKDIFQFCDMQAAKKSQYFFILGMRTSASTVENAIKDLSENGFLKKNNYLQRSITSTDGNHPRIEVTFYRQELESAELKK